MVGTSPMRRPSTCHPRARSRMKAGVATAIGIEFLGAGAVLDLVAFRLGRSCGSVRGIRLLGAGERAVADLLHVLLSRSSDLVREVRVALHELRSLARGEAEHVVEDEHLPVRPGPRTYPDGRNAKGFRYTSRKVGRDALEDDAERSGLLELLRVRQDSSGLLVALALDLEAAHLVDELRSEPKVSHHGHAHRGQLLSD